jgi:phosphopantothenoylcysteine decarboxylase/phosphopantothenate--cysteine ligase
MGSSLAAAAIEAGHEVTIITGPVSIEYPSDATTLSVTTTEEMLAAAIEHFPHCDGVIGAAAPCDYRPVKVSARKLSKSDAESSGGLSLELEQTPDILATLGKAKEPHQWLVAFALETHDGHRRAVEKLKRKNCDLVVLNGPAAIDAAKTRVEIIDKTGTVIAQAAGTKALAANEVIAIINRRLLPSD